MTARSRRHQPTRRSHALAISLLVHGSIIGFAVFGAARIEASASWSHVASAPQRPLQTTSQKEVAPPIAEPNVPVTVAEAQTDPTLVEQLPKTAAFTPVPEPEAEALELPPLTLPPPPSSWLADLRTEPKRPETTESAAEEEPAEEMPAPPGLTESVASEPSPQPGHNQPPRYPVLAKRQGLEGSVVVILEIDATGQVTAAHIKRSSGFALLDDTALRALSQWQFEPARSNGVAVPSTFRKEVLFRLANPS